jgi:hypothetical protein
MVKQNSECDWSPAKKFEECLGKFAAQQNMEHRDLDSERAIARETNQYLHKIDNQDFMICLELRASSAFWGPYLPKAWIDRRDDWKEIALRMCGSYEQAVRIEPRQECEIKTYFYGFELGTDLGYPELGDRWFVHMSDSTGAFYVPVEAVQKLVSVTY